MVTPSAASTVQTMPPATPVATAPPTSPPPTTAPPTTVDAAAVSALCSALLSDPYLARREATAGSELPRDHVAASCGAELEWIEGAQRVAAAAQRLYDVYGYSADVSMSVSRCARSSATVTVRNPFDVPLGVWGAVWGRDQFWSGRFGARPFHIAEIAPGANASVELTTDPDAWRHGCDGEARFYIAVEGEYAADQGTPGVPATGPQTSDDPFEFLPAIDAHAQAAHAAFADDELLWVEDLHSLDVPNVRAEWADWGSPPGFERTPPTICGTVLDAGPGLQIVAYRTEGAESRLTIGLFRKGSDGAWRWMGRSIDIATDPACPPGG